ncbi:MAG: hypothetical protein ACYCY0_09285 [Acidithiobacillus ferrivorans]
MLSMTRLRHRWFGIFLLLVYFLAGIPASYANWYQEIQQANKESSSPYQIWIPGQHPQLQPGGKSVNACVGSIANEFPAQQAPYQVTQRQNALQQGLTCVQKTATQVEAGSFPNIAGGLGNAVLFIDGFIHGFRDGFEQSAVGAGHFIYALFTHPGQLYDAAKKLIEHPSILYHIMQKLTGNAAQAFAEIVCSPAYEGGKEAGKIVGNVAFMVITAETGGAVAKSVASFSRELSELGISEAGSIGKNLTIDALHNIQDALGGAYKTFKSGGTAYLKVGKDILVSQKTNLADKANSLLVFGTTNDGIVSQETVDKIFLKLTGVDKMPKPITMSGKDTGIPGETPVRYTIETKNGNWTLRNYSSSIKDSGTVWTIEPPRAFNNQLGKEIKFKR